MSGGVVPADEIVLREQQPNHDHYHHQPPTKTQPKSQLHRANILSFQQLNAIAVAVVLSASGMIAIESFSFVILSFFNMYNSTRIFSLLEWVRSEISKVEEEFGGISRRLVMGRVLAVANLVYWSFNLFGFLLPFYVPLAFKR